MRVAARTAARSSSADTVAVPCFITTIPPAQFASRARLGGRRPGGERQGEGGDHGVAGAGHVGHLVAAVDRDVEGRLPGLEERHAVAAPGDEDGLHAQAAQQRAAGRLEPLPRSWPIGTPSAASTSGSFGRDRRHPAEGEEREARVDRDRDAPPARERHRRSHQLPGEQAESVVADEHARRRARGSAGAAQHRPPGGAPGGEPRGRSMRTICCFVECTPPPRMRLLTGVT